jgi:hypothetical protein
MNLIFILLILGNIGFSFIIWLALRKEQKRNRILQAFIAGIVRSVSDYVSATDKIDLDEMPEPNAGLPIPYKKVLEAVEYEFLKDVIAFASVQKHEKWLLECRQLFNSEKRRGDGFVFINHDLFDGLIARWRSDELMTPKEKAYLSEEIIVTNDNVEELQGEIAIYKDLLAGRVRSENLQKETIDDRLAIMFSHLKQECREKLKEQLLRGT